jgi:hypothetical protein
LRKLTFGSHFNQPIGGALVYLTKLEYLELGWRFNQQLDLPHNIKILSLGCNNVGIIENLPNSIEELNLGAYFNLELNNLPSSIKIIKFDKSSHYRKTLNNLPKSLRVLELPKKYSFELSNLPLGCQIIKYPIKKIDLFNAYNYS